MILIAGTMNVKTESIDAFMEAAKELMRATHKEEGNIAYSFSRDPLDDTLVHIFEKWASEEALGAHMAAEHMAAFIGQLGELGITDTAIKKYTGATEGDLF